MAKAKKTSSQTEVMDLQTLRGLDRAALTSELQSARKSLFVLEMKHSLGELKQPHLLKHSRRYIAQISTFLTSAL
jgi:ribosomal protein L29